MIDIEPDWCSPPGATIKDRRKEMGWNSAELARRLGYTVDRVLALERGEALLNRPMAEALARVLGSSADFWLRREVNYRRAMNEKLQNWFTYHAPRGDQIKRYKNIREAGRVLAATIIASTPEGDDQDAALRKVREAVMTANAAIALEKRDQEEEEEEED